MNRNVCLAGRVVRTDHAFYQAFITVDASVLGFAQVGPQRLSDLQDLHLFPFLPLVLMPFKL